MEAAAACARYGLGAEGVSGRQVAKSNIHNTLAQNLIPGEGQRKS